MTDSSINKEQTVVIDQQLLSTQFGEIQHAKGDNLKLAFLLFFPLACFTIGVVVTGLNL